MINQTAIQYYLGSVTDLFFYSSWWKIFFLFIKKPIKYSILSSFSFHVSNLMDIWTLREVIIDSQYEKFHSIPCRATVIDIGGSIGDFSIFAEKFRHAKKIIAYEPNQERIQLFKENIQLNHCKRIKLHSKKAESLTALLKENKISHCDFVKIDCEGGEYPIILSSDSATLKKVDHIVFEVHWFSDAMKKQYPQLKNHLEKNGFHLSEKKNSVHNTIGFLYASRK